MLEPRDKLIVRQVAFKGAIEVLPLGDVKGAEAIVEAVKWLTNEFEKIILDQT